MMDAIRKTHLLVFQSNQEDLLHERQLGLLIPLLALADVSWIKGYLMTILTAAIRRFGTARV